MMMALFLATNLYRGQNLYKYSIDSAFKLKCPFSSKMVEDSSSTIIFLNLCRELSCLAIQGVESSNAASPVACGAAIEVPLSASKAPGAPATRLKMLHPGAYM